MKAPFPYFGGKARIADVVWRALGNPKHFIEPFFGSGAVLLARPGEGPWMESVCDKDGFLANVWRSLQAAPDEVARQCDWPVNHADLIARKRALIKNEGRLLENLVADEKWFDPVMAGYWIWAASCWIGSGLTCPTQRPRISDGGKGVHAMGGIPHVSDGGKGVQEAYNTNIYAWFRQLSERLRSVRVVCGDWSRVCGGNWQDRCGICGMFFDPPYGVEDRCQDIYHHDSITVAAAVMDWCRIRGALESYRIVVAGYEEYHELVESHGWRRQRWKSQGGYAQTTRNNGPSRGKDNTRRETLYFSPHCVLQDGLFA